ncbi:MAG: SDR family NAD(P)-dependent oxidoreductase [Deltaproteobacteria bacterium]|nr:SDR family NAD(P)-dependent oxidoreductase [Deltaproteobacteria bacterium]
MLGRSSLAGQRVLITGAASGIGRACAIDLARQGAELALVDIDAAGLQETAHLVKSGGGRALELVADLRSPDAIESIAAAAIQELGGVDVLINNAGVAAVAPLLATSDADWEWIFSINVWAPIRLTRALLPQMIGRGRGQVVFVASMAGLVGAPGMLPYSTTKFALVGFAESLRFELADHQIDVTVVCPGYVRTNLHRATRYQNEGFKRMLDAPPAWYGVSEARAARLIGAAIARRQGLLVFGIEKVGWWLKRLWPAAAFAVARWMSRRAGILGPPA